MKKIKEKIKNMYFSYKQRIILYFVLFVLLLCLGLLFLYKTIDIKKEKVISYNEIGTLDYKVHLKDNEFYQESYLEKNKYYIASLIKNIDINLTYDFAIDTNVDMSFDYNIVGKLVILEEQSKNKLYERDYILKTVEIENKRDEKTKNIQDNISIDYDYYNDLANKFKSTYRIDASSKLEIYININKEISKGKDINLNETKQMIMTIPLTQKTIDIKIDDEGIKNTNQIISESKISFSNVFFGILFIIIFPIFIYVLYKLILLLSILKPKYSKYDKYIKKLLKEYDRLIVETPTEPILINKTIVEIKKFEELLDVRDNIRRPIMYYNLVKHHKCYFYIEIGKTIYLLIIKAVDLEVQYEVYK